MNQDAPIPKNELERIIHLSEFDLDYTDINENFKDLTKLAAKVAGTDISLINLIDTYTQWTIANYGLEAEQTPREDTVCQYTILGDTPFEVRNLRNDDRFKDKDYVQNDPHFKYYLGIPLSTKQGFNLGALCVVDKVERIIDPEKIELLQIIAYEIVNRLNTLKVINELKSKVKDATDTKNRVAHDIRGPLGGIISLAQIISEQGDENKMDEVLEFVNLIQKSGRSILELADEILSGHVAKKVTENDYTLLSFKEKLEKLYQLQALNKNITLRITTTQATQHIPFAKNKLVQIIGNLISNALKFTPDNGTVSVYLNLIEKPEANSLQFIVQDSGIGIDKAAIQAILEGTGVSTSGTGGEQGYGFGLVLVKHLIDGLSGQLKITSTETKGTTFEVLLPQPKK